MATQPTRPSRSLNWLLVVVAVALVATISYAVERHHSAVEVAAAATPPVPVPASVMASLIGISAHTWDQAGVAGAAAPVFVGTAEPQGARPVVLYIGAGFCPYCAAARWSLITSLARFGTFTGLTYGASSPVDVYPSTPTFSFYGSTYASQYVDFQAVELESDVQLPDGRYQPLQQPTAEQEALIGKYDKPPYVPASGAGGIPFLLIGGRYMWSGSPFSPGLLAHKTQADIAASLPTGASDAAHAILINGNQITAAICAVDGNQPAAVCNTAVIRAAIKALPTTVP